MSIFWKQLFRLLSTLASKGLNEALVNTASKSTNSLSQFRLGLVVRHVPWSMVDGRKKRSWIDMTRLAWCLLPIKSQDNKESILEVFACHGFLWGLRKLGERKIETRARCFHDAWKLRNQQHVAFYLWERFRGSLSSGFDENGRFSDLGFKKSLNELYEAYIGNPRWYRWAPRPCCVDLDIVSRLVDDSAVWTVLEHTRKQ